LNKDEWLSDEEKDERLKFTKAIDEKVGEYVEGDFTVENDEMAEPIGNGDRGPGDISSNVAESTDGDVNPTSEPGTFEGAEIYLPHGDCNEIAKVLGRKRNSEGNFVGRAHKLPQLDSRIFTVRFPDGEEKDVAYNVLAEHLYSQVDTDGNQYRFFSGLVGHRKRSSAVDKEDGFRQTNGKRVRKCTTTGWDIEVEWRDGSTSWLPLKEIKETNGLSWQGMARIIIC